MYYIYILFEVVFKFKKVVKLFVWGDIFFQYVEVFDCVVKEVGYFYWKYVMMCVEMILVVQVISLLLVKVMVVECIDLWFGKFKDQELILIVGFLGYGKIFWVIDYVLNVFR